MESYSPDRSVHNTRGARRPSPRTVRILQYLTSRNKLSKAQEIASFVKAPYNSVHRTLRRLVEKGPVKEPLKGFFELNHEDPILLSTYVGDVSILGVHRLGLRAEVPGLFDRLLETGTLLHADLKHVPYYRGRSLVFDADLRLFPDGAYYTRSSEPVLLRDVMLFYADLRRSLAYYTRGLAEPCDVHMADFELGSEASDLFYEQPSRVILYRKRGKVRVHVQFSGEKYPVPLGPDQVMELKHKQRRCLEDAIVILTEDWLNLCREIGGVWTPKQA